MDTVRCPSCSRVLVLADAVSGQTARCPGCHAVFSLDVPPAALGESGLAEKENSSAIQPANAKAPRALSRADRPIGPAEIAFFWIGFALVGSAELIIPTDQDLISRLFLAPIIGA